MKNCFYFTCSDLLQTHSTSRCVNSVNIRFKFHFFQLKIRTCGVSNVQKLTCLFFILLRRNLFQILLPLRASVCLQRAEFTTKSCAAFIGQNVLDEERRDRFDRGRHFPSSVSETWSFSDSVSVLLTWEFLSFRSVGVDSFRLKWRRRAHSSNRSWSAFLDHLVLTLLTLFFRNIFSRLLCPTRFHNVSLKKSMQIQGADFESIFLKNR